MFDVCTISGMVAQKDRGILSFSLGSLTPPGPARCFGGFHALHDTQSLDRFGSAYLASVVLLINFSV